MGVMVSFLLDSLEGGEDFMFYSSPLGRAMQTSTIVSDVIESDFQNIHTHDALKEGDMGCVAGLERGEWDQFFPVETAYRQGNKWSNAFPGGESYRDIAERVNDHFLNLISSNDISVVVTHEMVSKTIRGLVEGIPVEQIPALSHNQDSVYLIDLATREIRELDTSPRACGSSCGTEDGCGGCEGCGEQG